jgi:hypothetical protein
MIVGHRPRFFLFSQHTPWLAHPRGDTPADHAIDPGLHCARRSQRQNPACATVCTSSSRADRGGPVETITLPRHVACQLSMRNGSALSAAHPHQNETVVDFNRGRRIMAERRRSRATRERRQQVSPVRADASAALDVRADDSLRAFVRALARQAARDVFDAEMKRRSGGQEVQL